MPNGVPITEFEEAKLQRCGLVSEPCDVPNTNDFAPRARSTSASDNPLRASCTVSGMSFLRVQDNPENGALPFRPPLAGWGGTAKLMRRKRSTYCSVKGMSICGET